MALQPINYGALSGNALGAFTDARKQIQNIKAGEQQLKLGEQNLGLGEQRLALGDINLQREQQREQEAINQQQLQQQAADVFQGGNPDEIASFMIANPTMQDAMIGADKFASERSKQSKINAARNIVLGGDTRKELMNSAKVIAEEGGNPSDTLNMAGKPEDITRKASEAVWASLDPQGYKAYKTTLDKPEEQAEKTKFQQGTGEMTGYSFNPDTGEYSVNENIKAKLEEVKAMPTLDAKTRQGINKDFTQLTKDTKMIVNTAKDLEKLSKIKSGPSSIAMVFKFMKALDPTSVVREGEFATAENSAGVPESVRNIYNKVMEGGRLGDKQASQFVNTAKQLANTAIESSTGEVQSFVNTFEDTLPENFKKSLLKRVPKAFDVKPQESTDIIIKSHPKYGDVTEDDIQTTISQSGMTREQVLQKLGG